MAKIRTTFMPETELDVSDTEAADLEAMGVVVKTAATTDAGVKAAARRQTGAAPPPRKAAPRTRTPKGARAAKNTGSAPGSGESGPAKSPDAPTTDEQPEG